MLNILNFNDNTDIINNMKIIIIQIILLLDLACPTTAPTGPVDVPIFLNQTNILPRSVGLG